MFFAPGLMRSKQVQKGAWGDSGRVPMRVKVIQLLVGWRMRHKRASGEHRATSIAFQAPALMVTYVLP